MIKNQLVIYRSFAIQQFIFQCEKFPQNIQIPISPDSKHHEIECSIPFMISENKIHLSIPKQEDTKPIHEISEKDVEHVLLHQNVEVIIKYPSVKWTSYYTFFKNSSTFIHNISIINKSKTNFDTKDIKLVFRSIDHEYNPKKSEEESTDIPSLQSSNLIDFELKDKLDENFVLKEYFQMKLWSHNVNHSEIYQVDISDEFQKYTNSFIIFKIPHIILPGHLEMYDRTETNDVYSVGALDVKLYHEGQKIKIHFPKNKMLKLKNHLTKSSHSFFTNKTHYKFESNMKKLFPIQTIVHFYFHTYKPLNNLTIPFSFQEDNHYIWEYKCEKDKDTFLLEFDIHD